MWIAFWISASLLLLKSSLSMASDLLTRSDLAGGGGGGGLYCYSCSPTASDNCSSYSEEQGTLCQADETFCKVSFGISGEMRYTYSYFVEYTYSLRWKFL